MENPLFELLVVLFLIFPLLYAAFYLILFLAALINSFLDRWRHPAKRSSTTFTVTDPAGEQYDLTLPTWAYQEMQEVFPECFTDTGFQFKDQPRKYSLFADWCNSIKKGVVK